MAHNANTSPIRVFRLCTRTVLLFYSVSWTVFYGNPTMCQNTPQKSRPVGITQESRPVGITQESRPVGNKQESRPAGNTRESRPVGITRESRPVGSNHEANNVDRLPIEHDHRSEVNASDMNTFSEKHFLKQYSANMIELNSLHTRIRRNSDVNHNICDDTNTCAQGWGSLCACDMQCSTNADCCPEMTVTSHSNDTSLVTSHMTCVRLTKTVTALMVSDCPDTWSDMDTRSKCNTDEEPGMFTTSDDPYVYIPVYSKTTDISFRNVYCAQCHGIVDIEAWKLDLSECKSPLPSHPYLDHSSMLMSLFRLCDVFFTWKRRCYPNLRTRGNQRNADFFSGSLHRLSIFQSLQRQKKQDNIPQCLLCCL
jgi:hypothetical protein